MLLRPRADVGFTERQKKALCFLATVPLATPAQLGKALGAKHKNQGLGRLGGVVGGRLKKMGMVHGADVQRGERCYPAYALNAAGRDAVSKIEEDKEAHLVRLVRIGCTAADVHLKCSFPECTCEKIPNAIKAVLKEIEGTK